MTTPFLTHSLALSLFLCCVLLPSPCFSQLCLHSLHFSWEGNWLLFLIPRLQLLTGCIQSPGGWYPPKCRVMGEICELGNDISLEQDTCHLRAALAPAASRASAGMSRLLKSLHWQTVKQWNQGQTTGFVLVSVAGGRETPMVKPRSPECLQQKSVLIYCLWEPFHYKSGTLCDMANESGSNFQRRRRRGRSFNGHPATAAHTELERLSPFNMGMAASLLEISHFWVHKRAAKGRRQMMWMACRAMPSFLPLTPALIHLPYSLFSEGMITNEDASDDQIN